MTARVLVVDDLLPNIKLLEVRLTAEYFDVLTATNGPDALAICEAGDCDIVLLDVMMPGMDGFEVCRRIKQNPATAHLPVIMVTALDQPADRLQGLEAGADDFITKPVKEVALMARVKSLVRLKMLTDELRMRAMISKDMGGPDPLALAVADNGLGGNILLVDDRPSSYERLMTSLGQQHKVELEIHPQQALLRLREGTFDLALVSMSLQGFDGLRLCSQVRSLERTRKLPLLVMADIDDDARVLRALDLGVNDYLMRPIDRNEMLARARTQVRRKRFTDRLAATVQASMELAIIDPLTGLHNRRYMQSQLATLLGEGGATGQALTILLLDIDHFKSVNDAFGHDAGDEVLSEFAVRLKKCLRNIDVICRTGGEEFVVIMPDTDSDIGFRVADRLRRAIDQEPFSIQRDTQRLHITVSIGLAGVHVGHATVDTVIKRADEALYAAKRNGRNMVMATAA